MRLIALREIIAWQNYYNASEMKSANSPLQKNWWEENHMKRAEIFQTVSQKTLDHFHCIQVILVDN